ncbi:uncharacterized protein C1orf100 homolog isoform X3 [Numida meleagris]|uniref:uncharacterized protein C1orf100 homolog isoform X3 n=1 Tax=Numida meleagris TaxID=8996 RepID=UPI000B3DE78E|nr:uncharacterized protein C1orf100 homolog isoform X3 [Numida meleagris]
MERPKQFTDSKGQQNTENIYLVFQILEFVMLYSATKLRELVDPAPILPPGLVVRPGKDARGFYPGELGRVHQTHMPRGAPGIRIRDG